MKTLEEPRIPESSFSVYFGWSVLVMAFSIPLYRPWVSMASVLTLVIWLAGTDRQKRLASMRSSRLNAAVILFVLINLLSIGWSQFPAEGFEYTKKYWYLLLIPILASALLPAFRKAAITVFAAACTASALVSIIVFALSLEIGKAGPGNPSPMMHHIDYTLILALGGLLILNRLLFGSTSTEGGTVLVLCFLLVLGGLLVNIGRSGHLAFIGGLLVLLMKWSIGRSPRVTAIAAAILIAGLATVWMTSGRIRDRVNEGRGQIQTAITEQRFEGSLGGRLAANMVAGEIIRAHPLIGTGVGANMHEYRRILETSNREYAFAISWYPHFHNQYTQIATELGLLGLASLAWVFWELVRGRRGRSRETQGMALATAAVYLLGFLGDPFLHKQMTLVAFALIGGLVAAEDLDSAEVEKTRGD